MKCLMQTLTTAFSNEGKKKKKSLGFIQYNNKMEAFMTGSKRKRKYLKKQNLALTATIFF